MNPVNILLSKNFGNKNGFTIIEMLIVVTIISVLSGIVLSYTTTYITKARIARAQGEITQFIKTVVVAEGQSGLSLHGMTGSWWSEGSCVGRNLKNVPTGDPCYVQWKNDLAAIQVLAGPEYASINSITRDPWGSPYLLDENEKEGGPNDCRNDNIGSAGPDGIDSTADDIWFDIQPHAKCP